MSMFEYLKIPDIILSLFLHKNWTRLILLAPTVYVLVLVCEILECLMAYRQSKMYNRAKYLKTYNYSLFHLEGIFRW